MMITFYPYTFLHPSTFYILLSTKKVNRKGAKEEGVIGPACRQGKLLRYCVVTKNRDLVNLEFGNLESGKSCAGTKYFETLETIAAHTKVRLTQFNPSGLVNDPIMNLRGHLELLKLLPFRLRLSDI